jgi:APA family basic amino acid/polyamine antiporter
MIGTGVFTSVGFQLNAIQNSWSITSLWFFGWVSSLFGAFAYAELGTHYKESRGDYIYLSRIFHPMLGYLSAWAGLTVGFSAPVALAAMAFTQYLSPVLGLPIHTFMAIAMIVAIGLLHSFTLKHSSRLQNSSTVLKILFIVVLIIIGVAAAAPAQNALQWNNSWHHEVVRPGYAVAMVYVALAYTGWNAAAYVVDEMDNPRLHLPRALNGRTLFVMVVYMLFQYVLFNHATVNALKGKESVTFIAFNNVLGAKRAKWVSAFIALQLITTISSYIWVGSRVTAALAREHRLWQPFSIENKHGIHIYAIW